MCPAVMLCSDIGVTVLPLVTVQNIAMSVLFGLSAHSHVSKLHVQTSQNFLYM